MFVHLCRPKKMHREVQSVKHQCRSVKKLRKVKL